MDDQALGKRIRALTKAVTAAEPPSVVIALLEELKNEKAPTEEQLRVRLSKLLDLTRRGGGSPAVYSLQRPVSR